jgi:hypothetical protein
VRSLEEDCPLTPEEYRASGVIYFWPLAGPGLQPVPSTPPGIVERGEVPGGVPGAFPQPHDPGDCRGRTLSLPCQIVWNDNGLCEYHTKVPRGLLEPSDPSLRPPGWREAKRPEAGPTR